MAMDLPAAVSLDDHTSSHLIEAYFADCSRRFKLIAAPAWMDGINCTTDFKAKPDVWQRFFVDRDDVKVHQVMPDLTTRDNFATLEFDGKRKQPSELAAEMWSFQYAWAMVKALDEAKETAHAEADKEAERRIALIWPQAGVIAACDLKRQQELAKKIGLGGGTQLVASFLRTSQLSDKQKWALANFAGDADGKVYDNAVTAAASVIFHFVALSGDFWQASQAWSADFLVRVNEQEGKEDDRSPLHFLHLHRNDTCKQWSQLKTRTRGFADWIDDAQLRGTHTAYNNYLCVAYPDWLAAGMPSYEEVPRLRDKYEKSKGGTLTWALADKAGWQSAVKGVEDTKAHVKKASVRAKDRRKQRSQEAAQVVEPVVVEPPLIYEDAPFEADTEMTGHRRQGHAPIRYSRSVGFPSKREVVPLPPLHSTTTTTTSTTTSAGTRRLMPSAAQLLSPKDPNDLFSGGERASTAPKAPKQQAQEQEQEEAATKQAQEEPAKTQAQEEEEAAKKQAQEEAAKAALQAREQEQKEAAKKEQQAREQEQKEQEQQAAKKQAQQEQKEQQAQQDEARTQMHANEVVAAQAQVAAMLADAKLKLAEQQEEQKKKLKEAEVEAQAQADELVEDAKKAAEKLLAKAKKQEAASRKRAGARSRGPSRKRARKKRASRTGTSSSRSSSSRKRKTVPLGSLPEPRAKRARVVVAPFKAGRHRTKLPTKPKAGTASDVAHGYAYPCYQDAYKEPALASGNLGATAAPTVADPDRWLVGEHATEPVLPCQFFGYSLDSIEHGFRDSVLGFRDDEDRAMNARQSGYSAAFAATTARTGQLRETNLRLMAQRQIAHDELRMRSQAAEIARLQALLDGNEEKEEEEQEGEEEEEEEEGDEGEEEGGDQDGEQDEEEEEEDDEDE